MPNCSGYLGFSDASENLVMADDVVMHSNPPVAPIEEEELEEALLDMNVFRWSRKKESSRRVVRTRIDCWVWDRQMCPNPHALAIYLEFFLARGTALRRFEECQCEDDDVRLHCRTWVPDDDHYHWLRGPISPFPMEHHPSHSGNFATMICSL
jgi:hypothetical protein